MRRLSFHLNRMVIKKWFLTILTIVACLLLLMTGYVNNFEGRIYPNVRVAGINVGGLDVESAAGELSRKIGNPRKIQLGVQKQIIGLDLEDIDFSYNFPASAQKSFNLGRSGNIFYDYALIIKLWKKPFDVGLELNLNETKLNKYISTLASRYFLKSKRPSAKVVDGKIVVERGASGSEVNQPLLRAAIGKSLATAQTEIIDIPIVATGEVLSEEDAVALQSRAEKLLGKTMVVKFESRDFIINDADMVGFLDKGDEYNTDALTKRALEIAKQVNTPPQNPKFKFSEGRVGVFLPPKDGVEINTEDLIIKITKTLQDLLQTQKSSVDIEPEVKRTPPQVSMEKINNMGIKELIGRGYSTYFHSIPSRVHNIVLAASKISGAVVAPGETFSFNKALGDVSLFTGYQQAYVISGGKTVLGDGGGVCQVSTTLFRALLNAGLPITERSAHAYRVGYYEQGSPPGLDATVYDPSPDLKFINDTPSYILIEANVDTKHSSLTFELYGTSDHRLATITKPQITNITPPPPDLYIDDASLPVGTLKQIDFKAWGARTSFKYSVERDGHVIFEKTFISNYRPWQAIYLRGTKTTT